METCNRPVVVERLRLVCAAQDGVQPVSSPVHQEFRLADLHRSQGYLPSGSVSSVRQAVFKVCCRSPSLPVQGSLLQSLHGPSSVYKGHGSGVFFLHSQAVRLLLYLDDWLVLASSHQEALTRGTCYCRSAVS